MDPKKRNDSPSPETQDEAGIHKDHETPRKDEARTPPRRESNADADREGRREAPASEPTP